MFNKNGFQLLHSEKFPIVNPDDALCAIIAINIAKPIRYPQSVVSHLLALSFRTIDVHSLFELVCYCVECGWRPYRADVSHYEMLCVKNICALIDNYNNKKEAKKGGVYNGSTKKRQKSKA